MVCKNHQLRPDKALHCPALLLVRDVMPYSKQPESAYQEKIRGKATELRDHICKEMNPVNLHRCK